MKRFLTVCAVILMSGAIYEAAQWFREPSFETWFARSWFAISGAALAMLWEDA